MAEKPKTVQGTVGNNVSYVRDGNSLVITVDLTKEFGPSASGKTISIASTQGNKAVANTGTNPVFLGLNVYRYVQEK